MMLSSQNSLALLYYISGLAFFAVGLTIALARRGDLDLRLTRSIPALAVFAFAYGMVSWSLSMAASLSGEPAAYFFEVSSVALLVLSFVFLIWFGLDLLALPHHDRFRWLALPSILLWIVATWAAAGLPAIVTHFSISTAEMMARYTLGLLGGLLAAAGFLRQRALSHNLGARFRRDYALAAAGFAVYGVFIGIVLPTGFAFSTSIAGSDRFMSRGVPGPVIDTVLAAMLLFLVLRVMHSHRHEKARRLAAASTEYVRAQLETLEKHRLAAEQLGAWTDTLEDLVRQRTAEAEQRKQEAEAIHSVGTDITSSLDLDTILQSVTNKARELLHTDAAAVALLDERQQVIVMRATSGAMTEDFGRIQLLRGEGLAGLVVDTGEAIALADYELDTRLTHLPAVDSVVKAEGLRAHLATPLRAGSGILGVLYVADRTCHSFPPEAAVLLTRLAVPASIAIVNARLFARVQEAAVVEERERLGREIHDGVAQTLGYLSLLASTSLMRLGTGETGRAIATIQEIEQVADAAFNDAREAMLCLRVGTHGGDGLVSDLRAYLSRYSDQSGIVATLTVHPSWTAVNLPASTEIQLIRIVQGALSNVRKHAKAREVTVSLAIRDERAEVTVLDDGRGFNVTSSAVEAGRFGLRTMFDRARGVGGTLAVASIPGRGTRVGVLLPLTQDDSEVLKVLEAGDEVVRML